MRLHKSGGSIPPVYTIDNTVLPVVVRATDLGVDYDAALSFRPHILIIVRKAFARSNLILKCFRCRNPVILVKAFTTYVRPILEYASQVWSPHYICDIDLIESVQRRFTKRLLGCRNANYPSRLSVLNLKSLEYRRTASDLYMCFNILRNHVDLDPALFFSPSQNTRCRGHSMKLAKSFVNCDLLLYTFHNRVVNIWNWLPSNVVLAKNTKSFKNLLDGVDLSRFCRWSHL